MTSRRTALGRFLRLLGVVLTLATVVALAGESSNPVAAQATRTDDLQISPALRADCLAFGDARTVRDSRSGALRFIGTEPGRAIPHPRPLDAAGSPESAARSYLAVCGALLGLQPTSLLPGAQDPASQLRVIANTQADGRRTIVRFQQLYESIPVLGGEIIVHLDAANNVLAVSGKTRPNPGIGTAPAVSADAARQEALTAVAKSYGIDPAALTTTTPERWIYDTGFWTEAFSDGSGRFTYASGNWDPGWIVSITDFNADGRADLLLSRQDGVWVQAVNTGTASFTYVAGNWGAGWTVFTRRPSSR